MKRTTKVFFKTFFISFLSFVLFFGFGYFYLNTAKREQKAENKAQYVPYYSTFPESNGVLVDIAGLKCFFYLDFKESILSVYFLSENETFQNEIYGYSIDYNIEGNYNLIEGIIDIVGGIELEKSGEVLDCTGIQVKEMFYEIAECGNLFREVTEKLIEKVSINGFTKSDFLYIIENSQTNLTVPDCYFWPEYIKELCKTVRYIN